ncbi:MAG: hypothetical protein R3B47_07380 [Bacteroidia bacterium]
MTISKNILTKGDEKSGIWSFAKVAISDGTNDVFGIGPEKIPKPSNAPEGFNVGYVNYIVPPNHGHVFVSGESKTPYTTTGLMWIRDPGDVTIARTLDVGEDLMVGRYLWVGNTQEEAKEGKSAGLIRLDAKSPYGEALQIQVQNKEASIIISPPDVSKTADKNDNVTIMPNLFTQKDVFVGRNLWIGKQDFENNSWTGIASPNDTLDVFVKNKPRMVFSSIDSPSSVEVKSSLWVDEDLTVNNDFHVNGNLYIKGDVSPIIKVLKKNIIIGGKNSNIDGAATSPWKAVVDFGLTFREPPEVIAAITGVSAYSEGATVGSGGTIGKFWSEVADTTTTQTTITGNVKEGGDADDDNYLSISVIIIGRL